MIRVVPIMDATARFYSQPTYVGGFNIYRGSRRQTGGSVMGAFKNNVLPMLKDVGKQVGKQALGLAGDVAKDLMTGRSLSESVKRHGQKRIASMASQGIGKLANLTTQAITNKLSGSKRRPAPAGPPAKRRRKKTAPPPPKRRPPRGKRRHVSKQKFQPSRRHRKRLF